MHTLLLQKAAVQHDIPFPVKTDCPHQIYFTEQRLKRGIYTLLDKVRRGARERATLQNSPDIYPIENQGTSL